MQTLRTPEDRFAELPDFGYAPHYAEVSDGEAGQLRMAWVEDGPADGPVVLCLHGEPSWSFLYRKMMPVFTAAGLRVVCPDLVGFGRSDKPARVEDHSYARHVEWLRELVFDVMELRAVTLVGQDWGGLIGLRLAAEHPERIARLVPANTGLPTGDHPMPAVWHQFRAAIRERAAARYRPVRSGWLPQPAATRRARRVSGTVPRRRAHGRSACDAFAGAHRSGRPRKRGQPCRMGSPWPAAGADACRVQRQRPHHRADGADPAAAHRRRSGPPTPRRRRCWPLPAGRRGRSAGRTCSRVHPRNPAALTQSVGRCKGV